MSGHSKWSQIKRQKGLADAKRGQTFTKIANAITIAVAQGGGITDPSQNFRLRLVIEKARQVNMPKSNVERAIARALPGKLAGEGLEEVVYEGFAPGGVAVLVEVATQNRQRTTPEIKNTFESFGGSLGTPGAVAYLFEQRGLINVKKNNLDELFLAAADAGAADIEELGDCVLVYTTAENLSKIKDLLSQKFQVQDVEIVRKPLTLVKLEDKDIAAKVVSLVNKLEELDDVQKVYANFDIPEGLA